MRSLLLLLAASVMAWSADQTPVFVGLSPPVKVSGATTTITATGSTAARSLSDRFAERINVKDFGATGNGVTDDTANCNTAIAAASGKVVYFPAGTYIITGSGLAVGVSCRLTADGGVTLKSSGAGSQLIRITTNAVQVDHLVLDCNNDTSRNGIVLSGDLSDLVVDSCEIKNFVERGFYTQQQTVSRLTISNCFVHDGTKAGIAVYAHSPAAKSVNDIQVLDNRVENMIPGTGVGIGITVSDVNAGANVQTVNRVQICRNRVRNVERIPIEMQRGSGAVISNNVITGAGGTGVASTFGNNGISAVGCENVNVIGNYISDQTNEAIETASCVSLGGNVISGNTIYNCYRGVSGASPGEESISIVGNTFNHIGFTAIIGATNPDCIRLVGNDASTNYPNLTIVGNTAYDIANGVFATVARAANVNVANNVAEDGASALNGHFVRFTDVIRGAIADNHFYASGTAYDAGSNFFPMVEMLAGNDQIRVLHNDLVGVGGSVIQRTGFRANNSTSTNVWVEGNYVANLFTALQANGTTPTSFTFKNNTIVGCTNTYTVTSGQTVVAERTFVPVVAGSGVAKTSNYSIPISETVVFVDATGGAFNLTLPTTPTVGWTCLLRKIDATANNVTIVGTIDGVVNPTLSTAALTYIVTYDGTTWRTMAGGTSGGLAADTDLTYVSPGKLTVGDSALASAPYYRLMAAAGQERSVFWYSGATKRWEAHADSAAESGSSSGSAWKVTAYDDSGTLIDNPIAITRAPGGAVTIARPITTSGQFSASNTSPIFGSAAGSGTLDLSLRLAAGNTRRVSWYTGNSIRAAEGLTNTAESGSNAGSNYFFTLYDDSGVAIDSPWTINRVAGSAITTPRPINSTIATGTAPITVASTTLCTNLHASNTDKIAGATLGATTATSANILIADGSSWVTHALSGDATISNTGVVTLKNTGTASTYQSVTTDAQGRITAGGALTSSLLPTQMRLVASDCGAHALTGSTALTAIKTFSITAANLPLVANSIVEVECLFSNTNNANNKKIRVMIGAAGAGTAGTSLTNIDQSSSGTFARRVPIFMRATNSEVCHGIGSYSSETNSGSALTTAAVDTTADWEIVIAGQLANSGDTLQLEACTIKAWNP